MAVNKQLIDANGNIIYGSLGHLSSCTLSAFNDIYEEDGYIIFNANGLSSGKYIITADTNIVTRIPKGIFGTATADQVAKGATFTSASGLLVEGTASIPSGGSVYPEGAFTPVSNFTAGK